MPRLTPNENTGIVSRYFSLPAYLIPYLTGGIAELADVRTWEKFGNTTPEQCAYAFEELLGDMENIFVGSIFSTISALPKNCLWCDGSAILSSDYPELLAVIDPSYVHSDFIILPDLNERFLYGSLTVGDTGGEKEHTLSILEIPAHTHTVHSHLPGEGTGEIPTPIPDMPFPIESGSSGGGLPHNNLPPYHTVRYYIVVR